MCSNTLSVIQPLAGGSCDNQRVRKKANSFLTKGLRPESHRPEQKNKLFRLRAQLQNEVQQKSHS